MASAAPTAKRARVDECESIFGKGLKAKYLLKDGELDIDSLKGKVILVVNTAST